MQNNRRIMRRLLAAGVLSLLLPAGSVVAAPLAPQQGQKHSAAIDLPFDVYVDHLVGVGDTSATYLVSAQEHGWITVTVASHNGVVPSLKVDGGSQRFYDNHVYEVGFAAEPGRAYAVTLHKPLSENGLFRVIARSYAGKQYARMR